MALCILVYYIRWRHDAWRHRGITKTNDHIINVALWYSPKIISHEVIKIYITWKVRIENHNHVIQHVLITSKISLLDRERSFYVCALPMRDGTLSRRLSLAGCMYIKWFLAMSSDIILFLLTLLHYYHNQDNIFAFWFIYFLIYFVTVTS